MAMPNVPEQLSDAWTRLYRAKEIYDAFVNEVPEFMYQYVKGMIKGWSPESESFVVQLPHPSAHILKGRPRALIVDLVENLRSALDYMVFELSALNTPDLDQHAPQFVIADTKKDFDRQSKRRLRYLTDEQRTDFIERLQPFKGNHMLGLLRDLTGQSKHRRLLLVRQYSSWDITFAPAREKEKYGDCFRYPLEKGAAVFANPKGLKILLLDKYDAIKTLKAVTEHVGGIVRFSHCFFEGRPFKMEIVQSQGWNEESEFASTHK